MEVTGSARKPFTPPAEENTSGPVMSLPVSYQMKVCHSRNSFIYTLQAKLHGAPKAVRVR